MLQALLRLKESPSQTAGPYVHIGCTPNWAGMTGIYETDLGQTMFCGSYIGERIIVRGHVFDGAGTPLKDALIEIWQADAKGLYNSPRETRGQANPGFTGWGRCPTHSDTGEFRFETIKPGRVPFKDGRLMAPHVTFWIVARGINIGLHTRMYFGDEPDANAEDPVLARIEHKNRIKTLVGSATDNESTEADLIAYTFDIYLQGENETVFFDV